MTTDQYELFQRLWTDALSMYNREPTEEQMGLTFAVLQRFSLEEVKGGVLKHLETPEGRFPITPAHVVGHIEQGSDADWQEFIDKLERIGPYRDVEFSSPRIAAGVRAIGGWVACSKKTYSELINLRSKFSEAARAASPEGGRLLPGIESVQNGTLPETDNPVLKAAERFQLGRGGNDE